MIEKPVSRHDDVLPIRDSGAEPFLMDIPSSSSPSYSTNNFALLGDGGTCLGMSTGTDKRATERRATERRSEAVFDRWPHALSGRTACRTDKSDYKLSPAHNARALHSEEDLHRARTMRNWEISRLDDVPVLIAYQSVDDALTGRGQFSERRGDDKRREMLLDCLLGRHDVFMSRLVNRLYGRYSRNETFESLTQLATTGILIGYNDWSLDKHREKPSLVTSFLHHRISGYIHDIIDYEAMVSCPTHQRQLRRYAGYDERNAEDLVEIREFELRNGLDTPEKRAAARAKGEALRGGLNQLSIDQSSVGRALVDVIADDRVLAGDDMDDLLAAKDLMETLTPRNQQIVQMVRIGGYSYQECSKELEVSHDTVRGALASTQVHLARKQRELKAELAAVDAGAPLIRPLANRKL